jgi:malonate transporter
MTEVLLPVFLLIATGFAIARLRVVDELGVKALSSLSFTVFLPALLFRAMARTDFSSFPLIAPLAYFAPGVAVFLLSFAFLRRRNLPIRDAVILGLSGVFANTVMVGIPLVKLAYGEQGLAVLLSVIALHALVLMTSATAIIEAGERLAGGRSDAGWAKTLYEVVRAALAHPVILPILAGILFSLSGWTLPEPLDRTLALVGSAAPTLCLILLGASLTRFEPQAQLATALTMTLMKSLVHPLVIYAAGRWLFGLDALTLAVLTVTASLPIGANIYLLGRRYGTSLETISAGVTLSTLASGIVVGPLLGLLPGR